MKNILCNKLNITLKRNDVIEKKRLGNEFEFHHFPVNCSNRVCSYWLRSWHIIRSHPIFSLLMTHFLCRLIFKVSHQCLLWRNTHIQQMYCWMIVYAVLKITLNIFLKFNHLKTNERSDYWEIVMRSYL